MMKKSLKQKSIAVFLVLLIGMVLTVGAVSAQENIKESGIGEEIAVSNPEINMSLKPVFCTITSTFSAYNPQQYPEHIPNISIV